LRAEVCVRDASTPVEGVVIAGRYRLERKLGAGGMGSVWLARHLSLEQLVAIKFIHPELAASEEARRRFDIEAKAAARIDSRHAVSVIDHGTTETSQPFIVMEYLEGESLEQSIRRRGALPFEEVVEIIVQASRALQRAHEAGIVHRDLKPDNVFLAKDPEASRFGYIVKLVDFGIAKVVHDESVGGVGTTKTGMVLGTPLYMSPEGLTASAPVSAASDVWSLGACAFVAACARVPFDGEAIGDVVLKVCAAPMPIPSKVNPRLPRAFDDWFTKACARRLDERFKSAAEAADALRRLEEWSSARRERMSYEIRPLPSLADIEIEPRAPARGLVLAGILVGAASMLAVLGYYVFHRTRAADEVAAAAAASARAVIEAENERKLREADRYFWASQDAAAPKASASVAPDAGRKKRPAARRRITDAGP
jgi:serine/threonine protein kinase